jgi:two-component system sensor histidine kinase/response regulator
MSESQLARFHVAKSADVSVAARKSRMLAALADIERARRTRLSRAVTEICRTILTFGGTADVNFAVTSSDGQSRVEVSVEWTKADGSEINAAGSPKALFRSTEAAALPDQTDDATAPAMAVRRVGELLDGFSLDGWPGPEAVAVLAMSAPPGFEFTDTDVADWMALLGETQFEEALRSAEQRRRLMVAELRSSRLQDELLDEAGGEAGETGLVSMLSLVASQTDNGVAILDNEACVVWVNNAFVVQWGYELGECSGLPFEKLIRHEESDESSLNRIHSVFQTDGSDYIELLARQVDGSGRWTGLSLTPSLDESGTVQRWIVLLRDVTQQKSASDMLTAARDAAEQANRSKSEFLANMSHEIRTPMNTVIGMTELVLGTELTPEQREYITTVSTSAEALLVLLNDILDLSKLEAGKVELDEVDFDLAEVVRDALKSLAVNAHSKGLELATQMPMNLRSLMHGDPLRLRQVLINLVGNAIKFTDHGEVVVEFGHTQVDESSGDVDLRFTVRDTGIGIPADGLDRIFESFTQFDASTTRQFGGTGLGLTITSELLRLMGGHLQVESEVGVGSAFHVAVPLRTSEGSSLSFAGRVDRSRKQLEGRTVLVVDDNATNRRVVAELLTSWGLRPRQVSGADEALKELDAAVYHDRPFDLLLVDAMMPGTDGFEMVAGIRDRDDLSVGTVMMLSSADRVGSARRCRELSIDAWLVKPVSQSSLLESILNVLSAGGSSADSGAAAGEVAETQTVDTQRSSAIPRTDTRAGTTAEERAIVPLRVLIADDQGANRVLAGRILEKRGHQAFYAGTGREVLDLLQTESFDLILMDVQMPELDGLQATTEIRETEAATLTHVPNVALTAHAMKGDREKCLAAGMDAYLSKPLRAKELISLVEKLCEPVTAARIGTSAAYSGHRPVSAVPNSGEQLTNPIDFRVALDRMDGDVELLTEQMRFFLVDAPELVAGIADAVSSTNGSQLQLAAHRLKGLVSSYDQSAVSDLCLQLEFAGRDSAFDGTGSLLTQLQTHIETLMNAIDRYVATHDTS